MRLRDLLLTLYDDPGDLEGFIGEIPALGASISHHVDWNRSMASVVDSVAARCGAMGLEEALFHALREAHPGREEIIGETARSEGVWGLVPYSTLSSLQFWAKTGDFFLNNYTARRELADAAGLPHDPPTPPDPVDVLLYKANARRSTDESRAQMRRLIERILQSDPLAQAHRADPNHPVSRAFLALGADTPSPSGLEHTLDESVIAAWQRELRDAQKVRPRLRASPIVRALAVRAAFEPNDIPEDLREDLMRLMGASRADGQGTLRESARVELLALTLRESGVGGLRALRAAAAPLPSDPQQRALDAFISGEHPPPGALSQEETMAALQARGWFVDALKRSRAEGLELGPSREELESRRQALERLESLRAFVPPRVIGRAADLEKLHRYIDQEPVGGGALNVDPPFQLHAVGGMGKSTVVGRLLLDLEESDRRIPWALLDFDRPQLWGADGQRALDELLRQLSLQSPDLSNLFSLFAADSRKIGKSRQGISSRLGLALDDLRQGEPIVVVLDTWERLQLLGDRAVEDVLETLYELSSKVERLRVVISGRAPEPAVQRRTVGRIGRSLLRERTHLLRALDAESAASLLQIFTRAHAGPDVALDDAAAIVAEIGGSPHALNLAGQALADEGGVALVPVRRRLVDGWLVRRILGHLSPKDPALTRPLQRVAVAGLAALEITPELIERILLPAIELPDPPDAETLFEALSAETALVQRAPTPTARERLEYREELRGSAYKIANLSERDAPLLRRVHEVAIGVHPPDSLAWRYHQLALAERDPEDLIARCAPGELALLGRFSTDFPPHTQALLAAASVDPAALEAVPGEVTQSAWEADALRRAGAALEEERLDDARQILAERGERSPTSRLHLVTSTLWSQTAEPDSAVESAAAAVRAAQVSGNPPRLVEAALWQAELLNEQGRPRDAVARLRASQEDPLLQAHPAPVAQLSLERMRYAAQNDLWSATQTREHRIELRGLMGLLSPAERASASLARGLAAIFGRREPDLLRAALRRIGLPIEESLEDLGRAIADWDTGGRLAERAELNAPSAADWSRRLAATDGGTLLGDLLEGDVADWSRPLGGERLEEDAAGAVLEALWRIYVGRPPRERHTRSDAHFLDESPLDFQDSRVRSLEALLNASFADVDAIFELVDAAGLDRSTINFSQSSGATWHDVLVRASQTGRARRLVEAGMEATSDKSLHRELRKLLDG